MVGVSEVASEVSYLPEWIIDGEHLYGIMISPKWKIYDFGLVGSEGHTASLLDSHGKWKSLVDIWVETGLAERCPSPSPAHAVELPFAGEGGKSNGTQWEYKVIHLSFWAEPHETIPEGMAII